MVITTTKCSQFKHPEFVLEADEAHVPDVYLKEVVQTLEGMVADGSVFRPGQTVQVGWMVTQVHAHSASHMTLFEPDMRAVPIQWVPGITETLRQMMLQLFMLDSVSLRSQMVMPTVQQSLIACTRYSEADFFMTRSKGNSDRDSGWFIGCLDETHDHNDPANLRCVSLYEAYLHQRGLQGFISFPLETMLVMDQRNGMKLFKDGEELIIKPGTFLDRWFEKQGKKPGRS